MLLLLKNYTGLTPEICEINRVIFGRDSERLMSRKKENTNEG